MFLFTISVLVILLGAQIFLRFFNFNINRIVKYLFALAIIAVFAFSFFQSYQQYRVWAGNELSRNLLPPYQSINYFIFYAFTRFFAPYLISLIAAFLFMFSAKILNKKFGEKFFYSEEIYLGATATFLAGHPGWLFYVIFMIFIYFLIQVVSTAWSSISKSQLSMPRLSPYYLWIPTAIIVIIMVRWLQTLPWWSLLKI